MLICLAKEREARHAIAGMLRQIDAAFLSLLRYHFAHAITRLRITPHCHAPYAFITTLMPCRRYADAAYFDFAFDADVTPRCLFFFHFLRLPLPRAWRDMRAIIRGSIDRSDDQHRPQQRSRSINTITYRHNGYRIHMPLCRIDAATLLPLLFRGALLLPAAMLFMRHYHDARFFLARERARRAAVIPDARDVHRFASRHADNDNRDYFCHAPFASLFHYACRWR